MKYLTVLVCALLTIGLLNACAHPATSASTPPEPDTEDSTVSEIPKSNQVEVPFVDSVDISKIEIKSTRNQPWSSYFYAEPQPSSNIKLPQPSNYFFVDNPFFEK